jgi:hypothetical protein
MPMPSNHSQFPRVWPIDPRTTIDPRYPFVKCPTLKFCQISQESQLSSEAAKSGRKLRTFSGLGGSPSTR